MTLRRDLSANRTLLFVVCFFSSLLASAQDKPQKPQTKVVLYKDRMAAAFDTVDCVKSVIKLNPLLFFRGEVPVYFERALTPRLSLELGAGVTTRNYLNFSFAGDEPDDFGAGTEIKARPLYQFGIRYYTTDDLEPQGWYTQIELAHLAYAKDIRLKDDTTGVFIDSYLTDERIYNDLRLLAGYQMLSGTSNWLFDIYFGFGVRDRSLTKVEERIVDYYEEDNVTYEIRDYKVVEENDVVPTLFLGVKVGWGF